MTIPDHILKWIEDLRTPGRKQCQNRLTDGDGGFCCLGRYCEVNGIPIPSRNAPEFDVDINRIAYEQIERHVPTAILVGASDDTIIELQELNDLGASFSAIADIIERRAREYYEAEE